jgi:hypothetical protein
MENKAAKRALLLMQVSGYSTLAWLTLIGILWAGIFAFNAPEALADKPSSAGPPLRLVHSRILALPRNLWVK